MESIEHKNMEIKVNGGRPSLLHKEEIYWIDYEEWKALKEWYGTTKCM